jgi:hypothetical protein
MIEKQLFHHAAQMLAASLPVLLRTSAPTPQWVAWGVPHHISQQVKRIHARLTPPAGDVSHGGDRLGVHLIEQGHGQKGLTGVVPVRGVFARAGGAMWYSARGRIEKLAGPRANGCRKREPHTARLRRAKYRTRLKVADQPAVSRQVSPGCPPRRHGRAGGRAVYTCTAPRLAGAFGTHDEHILFPTKPQDVAPKEPPPPAAGPSQDDPRGP